MAVTKDTYDTFVQSVLAKVPEADRAAVTAAFSHPEVAPILRDSTLARSDYSRSMDQLTTDRAAFEQEVTEARGQIAEWQDFYTKGVEEKAQLEAEVKAYRDTFGELEEPVTRHNTRDRGQEKPVVTQEVLQQTIEQRDQLAIRFSTMLNDASMDHWTKYGERLDTDALLKYAHQHGKPIDQAYREIVAPRETARAEAELKTKLDAAREEGRQQVLTEHKLPVQPAFRGDPHVLDRQATAKKDSRERVNDAVARFNAAFSR